MCRECANSARELFPELSEDEQSVLLWEFTSFPFGSPQEIRKQLASIGTRSAYDVIADKVRR
jgi:hypothetical protein